MENGNIDLTIKCLLNRVLYFVFCRRTPLQDIPCDSIEDASQWCREAFQEKVNTFVVTITWSNISWCFFWRGEEAGGVRDHVGV